MAHGLSNIQAAHRFAIIYDGECPFCRGYVRLLRLKQTVGEVKLINARGLPTIARDFRKQGYDINDGMVVLDNGRIHYGEDAMHVLALLSTRSDVFNALTSSIFARPRLAQLAYPVFKFGRRVVLRILGRPPI